MIWQFIAQKYIFHLNQEAWHSPYWWLAPARVGRINYNGCIWEAEGLDDLETCVDEVVRDVGWNPVSPKTWQLYLRRIQKLSYRVGCKRCEFRSWLGCRLPMWFQGRSSKRTLHLQNRVAGSNFSPLRLFRTLYLASFWILHLLTVNQEWAYLLGCREKLRTSVFLYRRNPDTMMMESHEMPKAGFSDRSGLPPPVKAGITGVSGIGYKLCRRQIWNWCAYTSVNRPSLSGYLSAQVGLVLH